MFVEHLKGNNQQSAWGVPQGRCLVTLTFVLNKPLQYFLRWNYSLLLQVFPGFLHSIGENYTFKFGNVFNLSRLLVCMSWFWGWNEQMNPIS